LTGGPTALADGSSFLVDDEGAAVRVIGSSMPRRLANGIRVRAIGPLGQHDSRGTGPAGYRLYALDPVDVVVLARQPSPTPTPSPSPTTTPSPTASPIPTASATPSPTPTPSRIPSPPP